MRGRNDRQDPAGRGDRWFDFGIGVRIVEFSAPYAVGIEVLFPIPSRAQRGVGVGATAARNSRSTAPFEGERLHDLDAFRSAELEGSRVAGGENRVGPQQEALGAGPDAPENIEAA